MFWALPLNNSCLNKNLCAYIFLIPVLVFLLTKMPKTHLKFFQILHIGSASFSEAHFFLPPQSLLALALWANGPAPSPYLCPTVGWSGWFPSFQFYPFKSSRHLFKVADGYLPHFQYCHGICGGNNPHGWVQCLKGEPLAPFNLKSLLQNNRHKVDKVVL